MMVMTWAIEMPWLTAPGDCPRRDGLYSMKMLMAEAMRLIGHERHRNTRSFAALPGPTPTAEKALTLRMIDATSVTP